MIQRLRIHNLLLRRITAKVNGGLAFVGTAFALVRKKMYSQFAVQSSAIPLHDDHPH
jgi:hypothetical protein